uniref:NADH-ubiquinone oxidoreductase chain 6 n=2 Tax=Latimeria chalumnae TaxID=7897 RepID=NU6M_LATCH|nr:NADH dehydrogenase subunit 6 [Latimeria chalumnae]O03175.1 RecName: Full=NADH-ubiquinone oxidoreductase chain 6; AltName: Full=NADH dehydrogenase subunit 6 [Latimeria chalumnae]AAC60329.1 NADH dehydrogenase subunit 6 [Latimeria chalumnae]BAF43547.1 NADH dehydrogenase subunit 6 [Latimeria chalumnae]BAF43560.1 NADH dehydrogenase subunit 6 [Latimeria chalumnae]BAL03807.1 NADH dehydrogenase subunit 6 [Latimeria chalumnae]BAL03820.1 NADH dehydrogenase subunit 6 [Latimeria chalumnae]|eukprot:NP_008340.1 NADH dehydrogenase subunit 6 (mitochondrion) [Latimeria chalumnae]
MIYFVFVVLMGLVVGLMAVASNPAPYFAALGLVFSAVVGCGFLVGYGGSFLSLVLFLIYLGGMLVVFAYSAALAAEPYPESWGSWSVFLYILVYLFGFLLVGYYCYGWWYDFYWMSLDVFGEMSVLSGDVSGVPMVYSSGGFLLLVTGWVLLLALFVVLEITRGLSRGALRAV